MLTDFELVTGCKEGNNEYFGELVARYKKLIFSVVYNIIKDREDVEDIAQEVFVRIYKSLGSYNPEFKFSTWSVRITRNLCLDFLRKKRVSSISLDEYEGFAKETETPERRYIDNESKEEIQQVIDELPSKYRVLITLYHKKGLSYKEMAERLGEPMSIIKNRLFRARLILKGRLKEVEIA